jgi:hypothetical protein
MSKLRSHGKRSIRIQRNVFSKALKRRTMKALVPSSPMLRASRLLVAAGLAWTVLAGLAVGDSAARRTSALADDYRVVIGSNRDGVTRAYSIFPDGSRLTPLLAGGRRLVPIVVSRDGETVAYATTSYATTPYVTDGPIYVSGRAVGASAGW